MQEFLSSFVIWSIEHRSDVSCHLHSHSLIIAHKYLRRSKARIGNYCRGVLRIGFLIVLMLIILISKLAESARMDGYALSWGFMVLDKKGKAKEVCYGLIC